IVRPDGSAPGRALVVRGTDHDVGVVALVRVLVDVDEVHAPGVPSAGPVPREPGLGVDRATGLRRDEVESTHVGRRRDARRTEPLFTRSTISRKLNDRPPLVLSAVITFLTPEDWTSRYVRNRFPKLSNARLGSQQACPRLSPFAMICWLHVSPPSKEDASKRP